MSHALRSQFSLFLRPNNAECSELPSDGICADNQAPASFKLRRANRQLLFDMIRLAFMQRSSTLDIAQFDTTSCRIDLIDSLVEQHLNSDRLTLDRLANELGTSTRQLQRELKANNASFSRMVRRKRLSFAASMLSPGTSSYDLRKWPLDKRAEFVDVLKNGKGSMSAWGDILLPEEIDALWVYVATRSGKEPFVEEDKGSNQLGDDDEDSASLEEGESSQSLQTIRNGTLTACLPLNGGIVSGRRNGGSGFDYLVVDHIAESLELELDVVWFEAELEEESDPVRENYAMLSMELCDVVPGHPIVEGALGRHISDRAAPPRWVDKPVNWGHKQILLKPVEATRAYVRIEMGIVSHVDAGSPDDVTLAGLADDVMVGLEQGTLAALLTQRQAPSSVVASSRSYIPGPGFLWQLENREFDAALIGIPAFDYHVIQNPISELTLSSYRHPLGFDIGMAVLLSADELRMQINSVLIEAEKSGKLTSLAS